MKRIDSLLLRAEKKYTNAIDPERYVYVQKLVNEGIEEYNRPENIANREERYNIIREIGDKRKAAYNAGLNMEDYPLPWDDAFSCLYENKNCNECCLDDMCAKSDKK